jgi:hypothetical protein
MSVIQIVVCATLLVLVCYTSLKVRAITDEGHN